METGVVGRYHRDCVMYTIVQLYEISGYIVPGKYHRAYRLILHVI